MIRPKKPSTTEGMPASSSTTGFKISRTRGRAYCDTKSAAPTPSGTAKNIATTVTLIVPTMSGHSPYFGISETGCQT